MVLLQLRLHCSFGPGTVYLHYTTTVGGRGVGSDVRLQPVFDVRPVSVVPPCWHVGAATVQFRHNNRYIFFCTF
jgi:hypothetical protein